MDELPIKSYYLDNFFQRIKAAWLCLTGKVMVIGIIVSRKEFYKD